MGLIRRGIRRAVILDGDRGGQSSSWRVVGDDRHPARGQGSDKVIEDAVRDILVECPMVAVLLQIELQGFQFIALSDRPRS